MLAFLGGGLPNTGDLGVVPQASLAPRAGGAVPLGSAGGAAQGAQGLDAAGQALAACGILGGLALQRRARRSRVALGPTGGTFYEYKFRAKPGDKYTYRFSRDFHTPEWGIIPEEKGRTIKYGCLLSKGVAQGKQAYLKLNEGMESRAAADASVTGALLCDCDGTLVETERDGHRVAFNRAFEEKGYDCSWDVDLYGELLTTGGGKERMTRYFTDYKPEAWPHDAPPAKDHPAIVELHALKTELFMGIVRSGELPLRPGVEELLTAADDAGWLIAVCSTSNEESVTAVVETLLPDFKDCIRIFAGDCVKAKKPDPEIYQLAARELGLAPMKCVVLEDTNIGLQAGKAAGMKVIITKSIYSQTEDFSDADEVVDEVSDLDFREDVEDLLPALELA